MTQRQDSQLQRLNILLKRWSMLLNITTATAGVDTMQRSTERNNTAKLEV